jgi:hypothetical protein
MTDEELKELVASLAIAQRETDKQLKELRLYQQETNQQLQELACAHAYAQKGIDQQLQELACAQKETDLQLKETSQQLKETDKQLSKQLKNLAEQIGGLGNKFGSFTEGWAFPSMVKLLRNQFKIESIATNFQVKRDDKLMELDVFAYSNGNLNTACIVEVKSHVREEDIQQLLRQLTRLREFVPEHANKKLYGILAGVQFPKQMREKIWQQGLYLASIHDEHFTLQLPDNFQPRIF